MSQYVDTPTRTFTAGAAIGQYIRVYLSSGKLAVAGLTNKEIGQAEVAAFADGDVIPVRLRTAQGTCKMVAAGAITAGAAVYTAASGKIDDVATSTGFLVGTALEAATAANDVIEVLRNSHGDTANP